jgi:two-component system, LuxR family, response regulator FixJ
MFTSTIVVLIDGDERRRARICYGFSGSDLVFSPFGGVDELQRAADPRAFYLIHDDGQSLEAAVERIDALGTWTPVIAYSDDPAPARVAQAVFAGAMDYLDADFSPLELRESLARVAVRAELFRCRRDATLRARSNMERLSQREREVISALSEGLTNRSIALRLNISPRTVEIHRTNALGKMGAANSYDAIRIAIEAKGVRTN